MSQHPRKSSIHRYRHATHDGGPPPGKYAHDAPRLIGYAILLLALVLMVIGSMLP